jgi:tricorn protease
VHVRAAVLTPPAGCDAQEERMPARILSRGHVTRLAMLLVFAACLSAPAGAKPGYLSNPDLNGNLVVFAAEGDLWTAQLNGSDVRRLTTSPGEELTPRFSPDGEWIAFAGAYDGNTDVYLIPVRGGEPQRMTWHPGHDSVVGWTPGGSAILFRSYRDLPFGEAEIYRLPVTGGDPEKLPLARVTSLAIDPRTGRWAFTRSWGGGTWKRYRGGTAPDIWVGDPQQRDFHPVTTFDGLDASPMWRDGRIYFLSDQGGTANLWSMLPDGSDRLRHTACGEWDARSPAMAPDGRIVYTLAGELQLFDPADGSTRTLPIDLPSERLLTRRRYPDPARYITEFTLSPDGERLAVAARGEIFSVPVEEGITLPITRGSGAREGRISFDASGERILYITDEGGEEAILSADAWGRGEPRTIKPAGASGWHFPPRVSPDGKWIAYADQTRTLFVMPGEGGDARRVATSAQAEINEYAWSPDSRWLAYTNRNRIGYGAIFIYDTRTHESHQVTSWETECTSPTWDPQGRYLYFLSDRTVNPVLDWVDFESILVNPSRPYLLLLRRDVPNPLAEIAGAPPGVADKGDGGSASDKGDASAPSDKEDTAGEKAEEAKPEPIAIDFDGIAGRVLELPVEAGRYFASDGLAATESQLFFLARPLTGINEEGGGDEEEPMPGTLMAFDLAKKEAKPFIENVAGFELQPKAGKLVFSRGPGEIYVVGADAPPGEDLAEARVALEGITIELDPRDEWRQIFFESWREMRDFYWDPGMHGVDWVAVRDQYASLLPRIATRGELIDLLGQMIGELSTSHTYVWGGDYGVDALHRATGLLGARFTREGAAYKLERILRGAPPDRVRSPLEEPGVGLKEGDYILAVDLRPFPIDRPFEASFENLADKRVLLTVNDRPDTTGARQVVVTPLGDEYDLLYADWVRRNREYVAEKTGGKIGYIHIPDMDRRGLTTFDAWFYPQLDKEGMVVDVRWNGGGYVSQLILTRFQRRILSWDYDRYGGRDTYPYRALNGPFVVLINEHAGSDGDVFPAAVQLAGIAPIIGKRTWGGVVGIRMDKHHVDGGMVTHPEDAWWDARGGWGLEGRGVTPDIEVDDLPQELARGKDAQLDRAIEEVLRLHREHPPLTPEFGPPPDRSRAAYRHELGTDE